MLGAHRGAETLAGQQGAARGFSWKSRYSEALKQACQRQLLLVVYFRPVIAVEPRALFFARKTANLERIVAGVRVAAAEVVELRKRFAVKQFPAVVVLDCRENVLMHWQEKIPADLWKRVATMFRSQREEKAKEEKVLRAAQKLFDSGQPNLAYRKLRPLLRSGKTASRVLDAARELEMSMIEAGEERILLALAGEGLIPDKQMAARLRRVFSGPVPPRLEAVLNRELRRLRTTTIGGRKAE